jgi:hypothetical protein
MSICMQRTQKKVYKNRQESLVSPYTNTYMNDNVGLDVVINTPYWELCVFEIRMFV